MSEPKTDNNLEAKKSEKNEKSEKTKKTIEIKSWLSIILSIFAVFLSMCANSTAKRQLKVEENISKPIINVTGSFTENSKYLNGVLITNSGNALLELKIDVIPCFDAYVSRNYSISDDSHDAEVLNVLVPLNNSILINMITVQRTGAKTGEIANVVTTDPIQTKNKLLLFKDLDLNINENDSVMSIFGIYFLHIQYKDVMNIQHNEYYKVFPGVFCYYSGMLVISPTEYDIKQLLEDEIDYKYAYTLFNDSTYGIENGNNHDYLMFSDRIYDEHDIASYLFTYEDEFDNIKRHIEREIERGLLFQKID
ncbi:MAG: hypothetical protein IKG46_12440 [Solobacterium sp.]|nr:hypothetical protein [Solobacterium sp.]